VTQGATADTVAWRRWGILAVQLLGSALILFLMLRGVELGEVAGALAEVQIGWLLLALLTRTLATSAHELRIYLALLPWPEARLTRVFGLGFTACLVNTVVPARGGDILAVALLRLECRVPTAASAVAVGLASGLEALAFGLTMLLVLLWQGPELAAHPMADTLQWLTSDLAWITAGIALIAVAAIIALRSLYRISREREAAPAGGRWRWMAEAGRGLGPGGLALNGLLAFAQAGLFLATWVLLFRSLGLQPVAAWLAAALLQAAGSVVSTALPHGLGAGQAATAVLVLAALGIPSAEALALATLAWALNLTIAGLLGGLPTWRRLGTLAGLASQGGLSPGAR